ncbi:MULTISPECIES: aldehyde dehydrogenase (NADP(+)) [unclassified Streptomyces]|uniref:aldehyde dehydrogenase (NADP(+)) n=1 Tax=unclassified Streptomyces TaxID=2593676 RepID=UPI0035D79C3D
MRRLKNRRFRFTTRSPASATTSREDMSSLSPSVSPAIEAARAAAPQLAALTPTQCGALLRDLSAVLGDHSDELIALADAETRLGVPRLSGEVLRTRAQLEMFAEIAEEGAYLDVMIDTADAEAVPAPRPDVRRMLVPLGPVAVFTASNFPFAFSVLGGDTASALAAGCPVVVKAHEGHPRLTDRIAALAARILPSGALTVVHGREAGRALVTDPAVQAVGFTGSTTGGRALFDLACARPDPIPFYGEIGSLNPVVITPAALAERGPALADQYVACVTRSQGQLCTKPGLLFLPEGHTLDARLGAAVDAVAPAPLLGSWILDTYRTVLDELAAHPAVHRIPVAPDHDDRAADVPAATLLTVTAHDLRAHPELQRECFGPASLVVTYTSSEDLLATLETLPGSLTATVHGREDTDTRLARAIWSALRAGRLIWNDWPTGVAVTRAMHHGGPWPATTNPLHTSVGGTAIARWLRPLVHQNVPESLLPEPLQTANPWQVPQHMGQ